MSRIAMKVLLLVVAGALVVVGRQRVGEQADWPLEKERGMVPDDRDYELWRSDNSTNSTTTSPPTTGHTMKPVDCTDHLMAGSTESGVYEIFPFTCSCSRGVYVWCDMETDGGGWTVFLSRQPYNMSGGMARMDQLDFNRTWLEYKDGFGDVYGEHWLGNEYLNMMTYSRAYALRMDLELAAGGVAYATQETFRVKTEGNNYQAIMEGSREGSPYNTRYAFYYMSGRSFSTIDRDYTSYSGNCASEQGGGWWYYNCRNFNPTRGGFNETLDLTVFYSLPKLSITQLQLKLRPVICDSALKTIHLKSRGCGCGGGQ